eukprot:3636709-Amphidinium_carterae.1
MSVKIAPSCRIMPNSSSANPSPFPMRAPVSGFTWRHQNKQQKLANGCTSALTNWQTAVLCSCARHAA